MIDLQKLLPTLEPGGLLSLLEQGQWHVDHGSIERFPDFLQPAKNGSLSSLAKLGHWPHFDIGYRDPSGKYNQVNGAGNSAATYYDMNVLVRSTSIEEINGETRAWLEDWAQTLGMFRRDLRMNSWAVRGPNGIHWHFDPEDVIHFQIKGDKLLKFLPTEVTRNADVVMKRQERFLTPYQDFSKAGEAIVREGTVTIIPRGVWHWSESKSPESFAVALCVNPPSHALTLSQALYKRLRLLESQRRPMHGSRKSQTEAMAECVREATTLLAKLNGETVLADERRMELPLERIGSCFFFCSPGARVELAPLKLFLQEKELALEADDRHLSIIRLIVENGFGFFGKELAAKQPGVPEGLVFEVVASLARIGFLEYLAD